MAGRTVHQLRVTLRDVTPPVWRRVVVSGRHAAVRAVRCARSCDGMAGRPPARFDAGGTIYELPDPEGDGPSRRVTVDERTVTIADVVGVVGAEMRWDYDFGDGWEHDIVVDAVEPADPDVEYPICVDGRRACPPDDCGGPGGYERLLATLADPRHDDHAELSEWVPEGFDPEFFDPAEATEAMHAPRPLAGWDDEW